MIRQLHLHGWRAFDDLSLELTDGLTFVVAQNGVGKTSLVQAAAWGLFGSLSTIDAHAARRAGAAMTRVEVELELPDARVLSVQREQGRRAERMRAMLDGAELDDAGVARVMAEAFGASREFLSMTTVLPGEAVFDDAAGAFQLQAHLRRVFGVDHLQEAARTLQRLHEQADEAARTARRATRRAALDVTRLRAELAEAELAEATAADARRSARQVLEFAERQHSAARQRLEEQARARRASEEFADLLAIARRGLGRGARLGRLRGPVELTARLEVVEAAAADALDGYRREAATVAGQLAAAQDASSALHAAGAECPVCRRDLSPDDVGHADAAHRREVTTLIAQASTLDDRVQRAAAHLSEVRALTRRAARLPDIAPPAADAVDVAAAAFAVQAARQDVERLDDEAAATRSRRATVAAQVDEEEQLARDTAEASLAHRREAVASIAAQVMRAAADAIVAERIDPLAAEIGHRWKRVFGERGSLQLKADGRLVLMRGVHEIPFTQFSSGEKVVALLATRLLVLGASTRASFLWLDEPLEHLDPRNRRITASLMSAAGRNVRQILVTTYEEALARRLAAAASAELRYVRAPDS